MLSSLGRPVVGAVYVKVVTVLTSLGILAAGSAANTATVTEVAYINYALILFEGEERKKEMQRNDAS